MKLKLLFAAVAIVASSSSAAAQDSPQTAAPTLCQADEVVIFSCRVRGNGKIASLCGAKDFGRRPDAYAYYAFGTPMNIEFRFPEHPTPPGRVFQRTHLVYAGPTGAFAYSFAHAGVEYVVYSISGTGFTNHGLMAYRRGAHVANITPLADMKCEAESVIEGHDEAFDATLTWPENPVLEQHGLPF